MSIFFCFRLQKNDDTFLAILFNKLSTIQCMAENTIKTGRGDELSKFGSTGFQYNVEDKEGQKCHGLKVSEKQWKKGTSKKITRNSDTPGNKDARSFKVHNLDINPYYSGRCFLKIKPKIMTVSMNKNYVVLPLTIRHLR